MDSERASQRAFFGVTTLLFAASVAVTIVWCASMSAMGEMPMPGDWTMSMAWMRMPGQTWPGAAASFLGMWVVMMVAMMLPSLVPIQAAPRPLAHHARSDPANRAAGGLKFRVSPVVALVSPRP
jgi:predicted metal-binding membrane protein